MGVATSTKSLEGMPHAEKLDFFRHLINLATSIGEVLICEKESTFCNLSKTGVLSSLPFIVAFEEKYVLNILDFIVGSFMV